MMGNSGNKQVQRRLEDSFPSREKEEIQELSLKVSKGVLEREFPNSNSNYMINANQGNRRISAKDRERREILAPQGSYRKARGSLGKNIKESSKGRFSELFGKAREIRSE